VPGRERAPAGVTPLGALNALDGWNYEWPMPSLRTSSGSGSRRP